MQATSPPVRTARTPGAWSARTYRWSGYVHGDAVTTGRNHRLALEADIVDIDGSADSIVWILRGNAAGFARKRFRLPSVAHDGGGGPIDPTVRCSRRACECGGETDSAGMPQRLPSCEEGDHRDGLPG